MLREIIVVSLIEHTGLEIVGSKLDATLRKAASRARERREIGQHDIFAFLVLDVQRIAQIRSAIAPLGFPDDQLVTLAVDSDTGDVDDFEANRENAGYVLSSWLDKEHPSAIEIAYQGSYADLDLWWSGIESIGTNSIWPFSETAFGQLLPDTHRQKGATWLAILQKAMDLWQPAGWVDENRLSVVAACLCEWLHGFEGASGNSYNDFEPDAACDALNICDLWVGLCFKETHSDQTVDEILAEHYSEENLGEIKGSVLLDATEDIRSEMRAALARFFGGDGGLFYALYSAIWRGHDRSWHKRFDDLCNNTDIEHLAEIDEPWQFVSYGWSDGACQ